MASICPCSKPPGGIVQCPDDHFAYCEIEFGYVNGGCIPMTQNATQIYQDPSSALASAVAAIPSEGSTIPREITEIGLVGDSPLISFERRDEIHFLLTEAVARGRPVVVFGVKGVHLNTTFELNFSFPRSLAQDGGKYLVFL